MAYTSENLVSAILRKSFAPSSQRTYESTDLLSAADELTETKLVPRISKVREEYFVTSVDVPILISKNTYDIHVRAAGLVVREIWYVDPSGAVTPDFPRLEPEEITSTASGTPTGFYLKGNQIILDKVPLSTTGAQLRIFFMLTPSRLVLSTSAGVVSAINSNIVTVSSIPAAWATGNVFDLIRQDGGHEPIAIDYTSTLVNSNNITFSSVPDTLRVGDYVALAGETPVVQLPGVFRHALAQGVAAEILGDMSMPGADRAEKKFETIMTDSLAFVTPRVLGEDRQTIATNWG